MYVATASPRPKRSALDSSRGGMCPVFPPLGSATASHVQGGNISKKGKVQYIVLLFVIGSQRSATW